MFSWLFKKPRISTPLENLFTGKIPETREELLALRPSLAAYVDTLLLKASFPKAVKAARAALGTELPVKPLTLMHGACAGMGDLELDPVDTGSPKSDKGKLNSRSAYEHVVFAMAKLIESGDRAMLPWILELQKIQWSSEKETLIELLSPLPLSAADLAESFKSLLAAVTDAAKDVPVNFEKVENADVKKDDEDDDDDDDDEYEEATHTWQDLGNILNEGPLAFRREDWRALFVEVSLLINDDMQRLLGDHFFVESPCVVQAISRTEVKGTACESSTIADLIDRCIARPEAVYSAQLLMAFPEVFEGGQWAPKIHQLIATGVTSKLSSGWVQAAMHFFADSKVAVPVPLQQLVLETFGKRFEGSAKTKSRFSWGRMLKVWQALQVNFSLSRAPKDIQVFQSGSWKILQLPFLVSTRNLIQLHQNQYATIFTRVLRHASADEWKTDEESFGVLILNPLTGQSEVHELPLPFLIQSTGASGAKREITPLAYNDRELVWALEQPFWDKRGWGTDTYIFSFDLVDKKWTHSFKDGDGFKRVQIQGAQTKLTALCNGELVCIVEKGVLSLASDPTAYHLDDWTRQENVAIGALKAEHPFTVWPNSGIAVDGWQKEYAEVFKDLEFDPTRYRVLIRYMDQDTLQYEHLRDFRAKTDSLMFPLTK